MIRYLSGFIGVCAVVMLGTNAGQPPIGSADTGKGAKALFYTETGTTLQAQTPTRESPRATSSAPTHSTTPQGVAPAKQKVVPTKQEAATTVPPDPWLGMAYWVELERPGDAPMRIADPTRFVFRRGDRIRVQVMANINGYLYIVNRGSSGREILLFPHAELANQFNWVDARKPYTVPARGWIRFDDQPGEEHLLLVLAPKPLPGALSNLPASPVLPPRVSAQFVEATRTCGTKDFLVCGAKDLLVERDETIGQQATYVGGLVRTAAENPEQFSLISHQVRLQHR